MAAHSLVLFEKIERESRREVAVVLMILGIKIDRKIQPNLVRQYCELLTTHASKSHPLYQSKRKTFFLLLALFHSISTVLLISKRP